MTRPLLLLLLPALAAAAGAAVPVPEPDARTLRYYWSGNLWTIVWIAWSFAVPLWVLESGRAARLDRWVRSWSPLPWVQVIGFVGVYTCGVYLLDRPLAFYLSYLRPHGYGLSNQTLGRWIEVSLLALAVRAGLAALAASVVFALLRRFPRRWWLAASLLGMPLAFGVVEVWPVWVEPLFHEFRPLADRDLEVRVRVLAERVGLGDAEILEAVRSQDTRATNAYVAGLLGTKRIVLWDTLVERLEPDEVEFVMAHEVGHYALDHMLRGFLMTCAALPLGAWVFAGLAGRIRDRWGERWGVPHLATPAAYPLLLVTLKLVLLASDPVYLAISRHVEHEADVYALELTRANEVGARAFLGLQRHNLAHPSPGPVYRLLRQSHPALAERIRFCNRYRPWETGDPLRFPELAAADLPGETPEGAP